MANSATQYNTNTKVSMSAKAIPLYHHEQVPLLNRQRQPQQHQPQQHQPQQHQPQHQQPQQQQQTYNLSHLSIAKQQQGIQPLQQQDSLPKEMSQESQQYQQNLISGDLQDIIYSYQAHPELLKLILLSKLEEDKRRAEEAKLRAKELDLILLQQQDQYQHQQHQYDTTLNLSNENSNIPTLHGITSNNDNINTSFVQSTPPLSSSSSIDGRSIFQSRPSLDVLLTNNTSTSNTHVAYLTSQQQQWAFRRESVLCSSFKGSAAVPGEFVDRPFSPTTPSTVTTSTTNAVPTPVTATPTFTALNSYPTSPSGADTILFQNQQQSNKHTVGNQQRLSSIYPHYQQPQQQQARVSLSNNANPYISSPSSIQQQQKDVAPASMPPPFKYDILPTMTPVPTGIDNTTTNTTLRPRRRREMQAITKIVETREYPYNDGYFWKNNGNTVQKKTGNKSVYYKCSNSTKGCPVNKTVTWKDNGEFLIKYRGEHLSDCNKVQRIVDI